MSAGVVVFAQVEDAALFAAIEARIRLLERFYAPLALEETESHWDGAARIAALTLTAPAPMRAIAVGLGFQRWRWHEAVFELDTGRARMASPSFGPATLYTAEGDGIVSWSTHAVAAALVAHGDARVDAGAVPELLAFDFVGGERTLVDGVRCLPPGTEVELSEGDPVVRCPSPATRWELGPDAIADEHADAALVRGLAERLDGDHVAVALTAGLDSRVAAVALAEAGATFEAFTWGEVDWPDTVGAAGVAAELDVRHTVFEHLLLDPGDVLPEHDRAVRWSDGVFALAPSARAWPDADALVGGMGGETGRAFYYDAWSAWLWPEPDRATLADRLAARAHLPAAAPDAVAAADVAVAAWLDDAESSGASGWQTLDVVYADQRVRRWGRGQVPCAEAAWVPAFTAPAVQRALVSQPLEARLRSAFHHEFLGRHSPQLAPDPGQPASMPAASLRAIHRRRDAHRRRAHAGEPPNDPGDSYVAHIWEERAEARDWVLSHVLAHPLTGGALGDDWVAWTRKGFPSGERRAGEHARLAAAVVALDDALRNLRRSPPAP